jgi:hypothetical protein
LTVIATLSACGRADKDANATCPALERLKASAPVADATAAAARGDHRLLMLGGFVGVVPAAQGTTVPTRLLEGTGDVNTQACFEMRPVAEKYAHAYNLTLLRRGR